MWRKILKITLWTLMAAVLAVAATVMCVVTLLTPERLTPLVEHAANQMLDAHVEIGRLELRFSRRLPLLQVRVDSVTVLSGSMLRLDSATRASLPQWADTLLTLRRFEGGIDLAPLAHNKIRLRDVVFDGPGINLLAVNDSLANYHIYTSAPDTIPSGPLEIPDISIHRFAITDARPLRFSNASTGEDFAVELTSLSLDGHESPLYSLNIGGTASAPQLSVYNLDGLRFGADGAIGWTPSRPTEVEIQDFTLRADMFAATVSARVDFTDDIIVSDYSLSVPATGIAPALALLPDSLRRSWGIPASRLSTSCAIGLEARSTAPFNLTTDSLPSADITLTLSPGELRYQQARFRHVSGVFTASLHGNDLGLATFSARDFRLEGPATALRFNVNLSEITADPLITGTIEGTSNLGHLPTVVYDLCGGALNGRIRADISFRARPSMFDRNSFHRLKVDGSLTGTDLYYLSADTANMVYAHQATFGFGTQASEAGDDTLLTAKIIVDSADVLHTEYSMKLTGLKFGVGVSGSRLAIADTTTVVPMGGDLSFEKFYMTVLGDSIAFNMRKAHGRLTMKRYKNHARLPLFGLDIEVGNISTGTPTMRFMIRKAEIHAQANKRPMTRSQREIKRTADSLRRVYPTMPPDSVYMHAIEVVRAKRRPGRLPRVHPQYTAEESEIIYWGTSNFLRRLFTEWNFDGCVTASRGGIFTPYFPLRNRVRNFNIAFSNDSIILQDIKYKAGSSDFLLSGTVSNLARGLTSQGFSSPLKVNFELKSDTIDVNELASGTFRGSAYAQLRETDSSATLSLAGLEADEDADDEELEHEMGRIVADAPDSMAPLLVPRNLEASFNIQANNILYSDMAFTDFTGRILASQGALNLHELKARSDVGSIGLSALYSAPKANDIKFGFGLDVNDFNIHRFTRLIPAVDSIMPLLRDFSGIIDASVAATCDIDRAMNLELPTLTAAIRLEGDSLVLIDPDTYKTIGKWLMFKDKTDNVIKHMTVELVVKDNMMTLYPFIFDIDRYRLGVEGYNDLALNFNYHIAVLKSPLPFKFGVNISGNPDDYKVRLGKARLNENQAAASVAIVDTTRVNLLTQIENVFRRGVDNSRFARLNISPTPTAAKIDLSADTITHADSLALIREGLIPAPEVPAEVQTKKKTRKK